MSTTTTFKPGDQVRRRADSGAVYGVRPGDERTVICHEVGVTTQYHRIGGDLYLDGYPEPFGANCFELVEPEPEPAVGSAPQVEWNADGIEYVTFTKNNATIYTSDLEALGLEMVVTIRRVQS